MEWLVWLCIATVGSGLFLVLYALFGASRSRRRRKTDFSAFD